MIGHIMHCSTISSCQSTATSEIVKSTAAPGSESCKQCPNFTFTCYHLVSHHGEQDRCNQLLQDLTNSTTSHELSTQATVHTVSSSIFLFRLLRDQLTKLRQDLVLAFRAFLVVELGESSFLVGAVDLVLFA